jgi:hypothetical protein
MIDFLNAKNIVTPRGEVAMISCGDEILWKKKKYKREVAYLECTGSQYIDTGVVGKSGIKTFLDFEIVSGDLADFIVFGSARSNWGVRFYPVSSRSGVWVLGYGNRITSTMAAKLGQRYAIESELLSGKQTMNVNGSIVINSADTATINSEYNMFLFGVNHTGNFKGYGSVRVYACRVEVDNALIRDFVPVLDMNDVPCMYDKVSDELFYNAGTGKFLYGGTEVKV